MAKAFDVLEKSEIIGVLEKHEYWEMRFGQSEMEKHKMIVMLKNMKLQLLNKDIQLLQARLANHQVELNQSLGEQHKAKEEYHEIRKKIGDRLGQELKGCIIDDVTLEVVRDHENKSEDKKPSEGIKDDQI